MENLFTAISLKNLNRRLANFEMAELESYDTRTCELVLKFTSQGGEWGDYHPRITFGDVQVVHLPRVIHSVINLVEVPSDKREEYMDSTGHGKEPEARLINLLLNSKKSKYFIYANSVEMAGFPSE